MTALNCVFFELDILEWIERNKRKITGRRSRRGKKFKKKNFR
jgi:hypothetical protein